MKTISCAFTGHRPMRFPFGYNEDDERCIRLKQALEHHILHLVLSGTTHFYTGMALGVDQWAASIVLDLKRTFPGIRLTAVLPCATQAAKWTRQQRERYFAILSGCDEVITLSPQHTPACMVERNRYLVDHADRLLAVYGGNEKGGTAYTVRYAQMKGREITAIHPDMVKNGK